MAEENVESPQQEEKPVEDKVAEAPKEEKTVNEEVMETEKPAEEKAEEKEEKAEEVEEVTPDLLKKIRKQVEFYFSDVNMQRDKFLNEQVKLDDGYVPLTVMLNFKILASLSKNISTIVKSLEDSELMEVSEDKTKIRRSLKFPLPEYNEEYKKAQEERTAYVKGFPLTSDIQLVKDFLEPYEPIENVIMRKYKDKKTGQHHFKGSVFILFKTLDAAKAFMELESLKFEETELIRKWSKDYTAAKAKEFEEKKNQKTSYKPKNTNEPKKKEAETKEQKTSPFPKGTVIHVSGLGESCTRENVKSAFEDLKAQVAYVEYVKGNPEAYVRMHGEGSAKTVFEQIEGGKLKIEDSEVTCKILEGDEETEYLKKVQKDISENRNKFNNRGRGRGRGRKRNWDGDRDGGAKRNKRS